MNQYIPVEIQIWLGWFYDEIYISDEGCQGLH
jgi:hypothetical protein